ncbi:hypothetical protein GK48_22340 [Salmonella enterica subsp. diarizonae]|nr:hypothetical protein [Salmonella enterica subsp. diarizonae]
MRIFLCSGDGRRIFSAFSGRWLLVITDLIVNPRILFAIIISRFVHHIQEMDGFAAVGFPARIVLQGADLFR